MLFPFLALVFTIYLLHVHLLSWIVFSVLSVFSGSLLLLWKVPVWKCFLPFLALQSSLFPYYCYERYQYESVFCLFWPCSLHCFPIIAMKGTSMKVFSAFSGLAVFTVSLLLLWKVPVWKCFLPFLALQSSLFPYYCYERYQYESVFCLFWPCSLHCFPIIAMKGTSMKVFSAFSGLAVFTVSLLLLWKLPVWKCFLPFLALQSSLFPYYCYERYQYESVFCLFWPCSLHCFPIIAMKGTSMKVFSAFSGLAVFTVSLLLLWKVPVWKCFLPFLALQSSLFPYYCYERYQYESVFCFFWPCSLHCFPIIAMKGTSMKVFSAFSGLAVFTVSLLLLWKVPVWKCFLPFLALQSSLFPYYCYERYQYESVFCLFWPCSLHCFPIIAMKGTSMKVFSAFSGLAVFTVSLLLLWKVPVWKCFLPFLALQSSLFPYYCYERYQYESVFCLFWPCSLHCFPIIAMKGTSMKVFSAFSGPTIFSFPFSIAVKGTSIECVLSSIALVFTFSLLLYWKIPVLNVFSAFKICIFMLQYFPLVKCGSIHMKNIKIWKWIFVWII